LLFFFLFVCDTQMNFIKKKKKKKPCFSHPFQF
jgi:hypothetical protein